MILSRGNDSGADHAILQKSARRNTEPWSSEHNLPSTPMSCDSIFCPSHDLVCVCNNYINCFNGLCTCFLFANMMNICNHVR